MAYAQPDPKKVAAKQAAKLAEFKSQREAAIRREQEDRCYRQHTTGQESYREWFNREEERRVVAELERRARFLSIMGGEES